MKYLQEQSDFFSGVFSRQQEQQQETASTATAAVATFDFQGKIGKFYIVIGTVTVGASPLTYVTGGFTLNFGVPLVKSSQNPPLMVIVNGQAMQGSQTQYDYTFIPGTTPQNGLLKVFTGGVEISGAVPSGVSGDIIQFLAIFLGEN